MVKGIRLLAVLLIGFMFNLQNANADWVEARSENFIFVADISEERAKKTLEEMEFFRTSLFQVLGLENIPEVLPVRIYGSPTTRELSRTVSGGIGGAYTAGLDGPTFVMDMTGGALSDRVRTVIFHEYTHHITNTYTSRVYPRWYSEGYAEYLGTMILTRARRGKPAKIQIGAAAEGRGGTLDARKKWFSWDELFGAVREYPFEFGGSQQESIDGAFFYAQSWLAAHYIHTTSGLDEKLNTYLNMLNQPNAPEDAFETAFGKTPEEFGKDVRAYYKRNDFLSLVMTLGDDFELAEVTTRQIDDGDAAFRRGEMIRWFRAGDEAGQEMIDESYKRALGQRGPRSQIYASQALMASSTGDHELALEMVNKALEISPEDSRVLQVAGMVRLANFEDEETPEDAQLIKDARNYFIDSMIAYPDNLAAHFHYASSFSILGDEPNAQAESSAIESAIYYRGINFIEGQMQLADVFVRCNRPEIAQVLYQKAAIWADDEDTREAAEKALAKLSN